ncbi:MAG TPA: TRAP transporter small permease [Thermodesulfobacteriota bacterium]|nr:TRAP transporter small permease [Thermodesulfobacteriota bacterium]
MNVVRFSAKYFEEILSGILMVLMFLATFANVVARYLFNWPIQWAEEFSRYAFIWVVFLGAVVCTKHKRQIGIDSLVKVLPGHIRPWVTLAADLLTLALMLIIIWYGGILTWRATQVTATLNVPQYVIYIVVPASGVLGAFYGLSDFRRHLREALAGKQVA